MPVLIAATDHSPIGDRAVHYAASLASRQGWRLVVVHAYYMPVTFNDPAIPIIAPDDLLETARNRMVKMEDGLRTGFPGLDLQTRVEYGDIQDVLSDAVEVLSPVLLIAGSHDEQDADMWMGSTTLSLLRHMRCPVLVVPPALDYREVRQICLAMDLSGTQDVPVQALGQLQQVTGAALHLLHVGREGEPELLTPAPALESMGITLHYIRTEGSIDQKIAEFCDTHGMDWLAIIPQHHSFWESLFHKSHTKGVVRLSHVPVLALHTS